MELSFLIEAVNSKKAGEKGYLRWSRGSMKASRITTNVRFLRYPTISFPLARHDKRWLLITGLIDISMLSFFRVGFCPPQGWCGDGQIYENKNERMYPNRLYSSPIWRRVINNLDLD